MNIFVFGGTGFIGRALCARLSEDTHRVVAIDNGTIRPEKSLPGGMCQEVLDVTKPTKMRKFINTHRPQVIYWLAAKQGYGDKYSQFAANNVAAIYTLFEAIDAVGGYRPERIILASSQAVYSVGCEGVPEQWPCSPHSVYGQSKLQQEQAAKWFCFERGIPFVALRYSIVLGGGQALQVSESGMLRNWYRAFMLDEQPEIYGRGTHVRDFVHINDVTRANVMALSGEPGIYNVAGFASNILGMFGIFRSISGCKEALVLNRDMRPGGEYSLTSSANLIKGKWGWEPEFALERQVEDFFEFAESKR